MLPHQGLETRIESLDELSQRTNNVWSDDLTQIMNDIAAADGLETDQLIKIVRAERF